MIMQIAVWVIIILVIAFLIWLLKRWIKRIIFILILLALAFFIYGIFNPSWAAKLWYNVRTFPSRMASRMWSGKEYLDYNAYKSKISSIWDDISDSIWDKIDDIDLSIDDEDIEDVDLDNDEIDVDIDYEDDYGSYDDYEEKTEYVSENDEKPTKNTGKNVIKAFPKAVRFIEIPEMKQEVEHDHVWVLSWYSRTDLLWVINRYLEKNLDDNTDVLVTVEYDEDSADPQKIILQTQSKKEHSVINSDNLMDEIFSDSDRKVPEDIEIIPAESTNSEPEKTQTVQKQESAKKQVQTNKKTTSTSLTQKEQKEAEEIFWILF